MSNRRDYPLTVASKVAAEMVLEIAPYCEKLQVAGSVRRCKRYVGDVEILYVPYFAKKKRGLFPGADVDVDLAEPLLNSLVEAKILSKRLNAKGTPMWGDKNKFAVHVATGIPIDFFATTLENWWVSLVVRTGSRETCMKLTNGANNLGRSLKVSGCGVMDERTDEMLIAHSEEDVFRFCGQKYVAPEYR